MTITISPVAFDRLLRGDEVAILGRTFQDLAPLSACLDCMGRRWITCHDMMTDDQEAMGCKAYQSWGKKECEICGTPTVPHRCPSCAFEVECFCWECRGSGRDGGVCQDCHGSGRRTLRVYSHEVLSLVPEYDDEPGHAFIDVEKDPRSLTMCLGNGEVDSCYVSWEGDLREYHYALRIFGVDSAGKLLQPPPQPEPEFEHPILQFFVYEHLREDLQQWSRPFCELGRWVVENLPDNMERDAALRKLLEAKDAAVRAKLMKVD